MKRHPRRYHAAVARPLAETDLGLRYRFAEHIAPLASGVPIWMARSRFVAPVSLHDHDFLEIEIVEQGTAEHVTIRGREAVGVGHIAILHPGHWHGYDRPRGLALCDIYCDTRLFARELSWMAADPLLAALVPPPMVRNDRERRRASQGIITIAADAPLLAQVRRLARAIARTAAATPLPRARLIGHLLLLLDLLAAQAPVRTLSAQRMDSRVAVAQAALSRDLAANWRVSRLAEEVGLSASQLMRRMKRATGRSPLQWLIRARAERLATLLLRDTRPVRELAPLVGWHEPSYAARRFRAIIGCSPAAFRRQRTAPG